MVEKLILKSIEEEAADCRKAFEGVEIGAWVSHCHHRVPFEKLVEPAENRIYYIGRHKPLEEQALRFRFFRPMSKEDSDSLGAKLTVLEEDYATKRAAGGITVYEDYQVKVCAAYADYQAKISALHREYCTEDCPWNGETLFPERED